MLSRHLTVLSTLLLVVPVACSSGGSDGDDAGPASNPSVASSLGASGTTDVEADIPVVDSVADDDDLAATVALLRDGGVTIVSDDELDGAAGDPFAITALGHLRRNMAMHTSTSSR